MKRAIISLFLVVFLFNITIAQVDQRNKVSQILAVPQSVGIRQSQLRSYSIAAVVADSFILNLKKAGSKNIAQHLYTPEASSNSAFINTNANLSLESEFGDQFASASIGKIGRNFSFSVQIKQPFEEKPKVVTPLSLDGLDNGTSVKIGLQRNFWRLKSEAEMRTILAEIIRDFYLKNHFDSLLIPCNNFVNTVKDGKTEYFYRNKSKIIRIDSLKTNGCCCNKKEDVEFWGYFVKKSLNLNDSLAISLLNFGDIDPVSQSSFFERVYIKTLFISASGAIAKNSFDYISDSFSIFPTLSETHINKSFKITAGKIFNPEDKDAINVLALSFIYSLGYEAGSEPVEYSFPIGTLGVNYSQKVTIGVPSQKTNTRVALEWRKKLQVFRTHTIAVSPSLTYLFNKKSIAVTLPVYIFQYRKDDKIAGLQGGFKLAFLTKTNQAKLTKFSDGFSASIFIAAPFDLFSF